MLEPEIFALHKTGHFRVAENRTFLHGIDIPPVEVDNGEVKSYSFAKQAKGTMGLECAECHFDNPDS